MDLENWENNNGLQFNLLLNATHKIYDEINQDLVEDKGKRNNNKKKISKNVKNTDYLPIQLCDYEDKNKK